MTPHIHRSILISFTSSLFSWLFVVDHVHGIYLSLLLISDVCTAENITAQIAAADASSADSDDTEAGEKDDSDAEGDDDGETAEDEMDSDTEDEFMQKINSVSASESDERTDPVDKEEL